MKRSPWYARYPGDYLRDTAHLSLMENGAYTLLLDHYYSTGPLLVDKDGLYRVCKASTDPERVAVDSVLSQFFKERNRRYHNPRADRELEIRAEHREKLEESGRRGASRRWSQAKGSHSEAIGQANGFPNGPSIASPHPQSQSQKEKTHSPRKSSAESPPFDEQGFSEFWKAYPRRQAKQDARKAWNRIAPDERPKIMAAVASCSTTEEWRRENGRFIPYPATFLNGKRWEDEITHSMGGPNGDSRTSKREAARRANKAAGDKFRNGIERLARQTDGDVLNRTV